MKSLLLLFFTCFIFSLMPAQPPLQALQLAVRNLEQDGQMKHAILGLYIVDTKTGSVVYNRNADLGFAMASSQKVLTSAAGFEVLGKTYRYKTSFSYSGSVQEGVLHGDIFIKGTGDPSFGSWRWKSTNQDFILAEITAALSDAKITRISGRIWIDNSSFNLQPIPDGWIWQDIGNYYGAGSWAVNWDENQYDLHIKPGKKEGDSTTIIAMRPDPKLTAFDNEIRTGEKGSGDNAYIYLAPRASAGFAKGTVPVGVTSFSISGSLPDPEQYFCRLVDSVMSQHGIRTDSGCAVTRKLPAAGFSGRKMLTPILTHISPAFDSLNYWFLKKSINLYGEAFLKTIALEKSGEGSTEKGVELIKSFLNSTGIESSAVNILDGSGLSPQNRITPIALVMILQYARKKPWFPSFYDALPEINGIRMKSGSISGVRSFTGFIENKQGRTYSFAIVVNNFNGSASDMVRKIYRVLDVLK